MTLSLTVSAAENVLTAEFKYEQSYHLHIVLEEICDAYCIATSFM